MRVPQFCFSMVGGVVLAALGWATPSWSQSCTWGGTSTVPAPSAVSLRSYGLLHSPGRVAASPTGDMYVTDPVRGRVLVRDQWGRIVHLQEGLARPLGIAVDGFGVIYVGEEATGSVTAFDADWNRLYALGRGDGEFAMPNHIAVDPTRGTVFVADSGANEVKVFDGTALVARFGTGGTSAGQFSFPTGVFVSAAGEVFVADQNNDRIQVFDRDGGFLRCFVRRGRMSFRNKFGRVQGLTGDSAGRLYVADALQGEVRVFDANGVALATLGEFGEGPGQLQLPAGLAVDPNNRLLVACSGGGAVELFGLDEFSDPQVLGARVRLPRRVLVGPHKTSSHPSRRNRYRRLRALVRVPEHRASDVEGATITANGVAASSWQSHAKRRSRAGSPVLLVEFDRQEVLATLPPSGGLVTISGELVDGTPFEGAGTIKVVSRSRHRAARARRADSETAGAVAPSQPSRGDPRPTATRVREKTRRVDTTREGRER